MANGWALDREKNLIQEPSALKREEPNLVPSWAPDQHLRARRTIRINSLREQMDLFRVEAHR
jgi:hypothetical protein